MKQYHDLLTDILTNGEPCEDRTGTGTNFVVGRQMRFNLADGFPLLTTKRVNINAVIHELLWFLSGSTNEKDLRARGGTRIWSEWATAEKTALFGRAEGDLGRTYGQQWRNYGGTKHDSTCANLYGTFECGPVKNGYHCDGLDQIAKVIHQIKTTPTSRRIIVNAWNPAEADSVALPPCHSFFQFIVNVAKGTLSCCLYQRSGDVFLGVPFNIASYALLTRMIAQVTSLMPGEFVHTIGDAHIYTNHFDQVRLQLTREPRALPTMELNPHITDIDEFHFDDFTLHGYDPHPPIKAKVSI